MAYKGYRALRNLLVPWSTGGDPGIKMKDIMKRLLSIILALSAAFLAGCNLTLAQDITPPPGYVPASPVPTPGPLYPATAPDLENGAAIYSQKCAPCHGETGLGDGAQGKQLPVSVAALGLPETARAASPARWFAVVTQGNLDRFMPPFTSLSEEDRWDVVSYALSLHTNAAEVEHGRALFETACTGCDTSYFEDQRRMAELSNSELARIIQAGGAEVPAFAADLSEEDAWALAAYLRTLTLSSSLAAAVPAPATRAPVTPQGEPLATPGTPPAQPESSGEPSRAGTVSGSIENKTDAALPSDLKVILRAYEHEADPSRGPLEIFSLEGTVQADGAFRFEDVDFKPNRIFAAETTLEGLAYRSEFGIVEAGATELLLPSIPVYRSTTETEELAVDSLQIFFDYANADSVQIFYVYHLLNAGNQTILVNVGTTQDIPFIKFPAGAQNQGYEQTGDGAGFLATETGFAIPPSDSAYGLIAFASVPKEKTIEISQPIVMPVGPLTLFLPQGVNASGEKLVDEGLQDVQNTSFNIYSTDEMQAGEALNFKLSGFPKDTGRAADLTQNQALILGAAGLGAVLILAGLWMYLRERNRVNEAADDDDDDEADDPADLIDAIAALDDLHRAGKLTTEVYQQRRADLKARLREGL